MDDDQSLGDLARDDMTLDIDGNSLPVSKEKEAAIPHLYLQLIQMNEDFIAAQQQQPQGQENAPTLAEQMAPPQDLFMEQDDNSESPGDEF